MTTVATRWIARGAGVLIKFLVMAVLLWFELVIALPDLVIQLHDDDL